MEDFIKPIREQLIKYRNDLKNDNDEFNEKLNLTRKNLFNYIDRQIESLIEFKEESEKEFNYLYEENKKTCYINQEQFDKLCLLINRNDSNSILVSKWIEEFKVGFSMRPKMLKSIPQYDFKDIQINDFIKKQETKQNEYDDNSSTLSTIDYNSSSIMINEHTESLVLDNHSSFILVDNTQNSPILANSIGFSHHKQFSLENNEIVFESQSRLPSTCSTIMGLDHMIDISFKISYQHNRSHFLICFNDEENYLLIYSLSSYVLEHLSINSRRISPINLPFSESILNLNYSKNFHLFYCTTQQTNRFILFRLNSQQKNH